MIDRTMRWLVLVAALRGSWRTEGRGAEPLPPRAVARIGDHRFYHGPGITCIALSPDGRRAASAAREHDADEIVNNGASLYDRLIVVWDAASGERLHELHVPQGTVSRLAFSPDGKRLAASYAISEDPSEPRSGLVLFDVETGKLHRRLSEFQAEIGLLQFSPDGKQLRVSEWSGPLSTWVAATGKRLRLWKPPPSKTLGNEARKEGAMEGVMSPDGRVIVWKIASCSTGGCPSVSMDGLRVVDAETNRTLYQRKFSEDPDEEHHHDEFLWSFAFSRDGKRIVADCGKLVVWDAATGKELESFKVPGMVCCALAPDVGRAVIEESVAGRSRSRLRLWDIRTGKPLRELHYSFRDLSFVLRRISLDFSANGERLMIATDSTLRFYDARTGEERPASGHRAHVAPRFSNDGRTLFTTCAEKRCCWNLSENKLTLIRSEPRKAWETERLAQSADGQLFLDHSPEVGKRVRERATGRSLQTIPDNARSAVFSPDATRLLLYDDENSDRAFALRVYDIKAGKKSAEIKNITLCGQPVFSPDGRLLAWPDAAGDIHLNDVVTGKSVRTLRQSLPLPKGGGLFFYSFRLTFSPNGEKLIATNYYIDCSMASAREVMLPCRIFSVSSGKQAACFSADGIEPSKSNSLSCMTCSPDGRLLAVAEKQSGVVRLLEIASGKTRVEFVGHRHGVHGLAFSPDGRMLVSGGEDNVVFLWDVTGAKMPAASPERDSDLSAIWTDLASDDAKRAGIAIASFIHKSDRSVTFLQRRLRPEKEIDDKHLAQWIADLDSDTYATREAASRELFRSGERAEAMLHRTLKNRPTLEVRKRIENLLHQLESGQLPSETLRIVRAIETLEHIGTPAAWRCLDSLAKGAATARPTREAKASLQRLANRK